MTPTRNPVSSPTRSRADPVIVPVDGGHPEGQHRAGGGHTSDDLVMAAGQRLQRGGIGEQFFQPLLNACASTHPTLARLADS